MIATEPGFNEEEDVTTGHHHHLRSFPAQCHPIIKIYPLHQYLITANLSSSALYRYSTPWIQGWTPKTIIFFDKYGELTLNWMSHIPVDVAYNRGQFEDYSDRKKEIYVLGLILLQLGHRKCGELIKDEKMVQKALASLCMTVGKRYKQVVIL